MLETLSNIKNNKIRNGPTSSGAADKELVLKLKKFLNGLSKKRATRSTEALRVSLDDIHNIDTKGNTTTPLHVLFANALSRQMVVGWCILEG